MANSCAIRGCLALVMLLGIGRAAADSKEVGEVLNVLLPAAALVQAGFREESHEGLKQFLKAAVTAELTTEALKTLIDKERPNGRCCTAFPSGHATRAFYAATFLDRRYGRKFGYVVYPLAAVVAWSRVDSNVHDEADVGGGALIGYLAARYFTTKYERVQVTPIANADFIGVALHAAFD